ncbi:MAG: hypothetical protein D6699_02305 [Aquificota bacterium]|nr:MAG: hypothetical protein D6699_02305 [Aquificota bacterium]
MIGLETLIERLSKGLGKEKPELIEEALINYIKTIKNKLDKESRQLLTELLEDYLDAKVAEERLENLKEGRSYTVPAEEVYKELGI